MRTVVFEHFDEDARRRVISLAAEEARRRGDGRVGTEHLLLAVGVGVERARTALDALDREALAAVGIDVAHVASPVPVLTRRRPPFTSGARAVLHRAVVEARTAKARRVQARHLLLGVLSCLRPDPAAQLLGAVGVDPTEVRDRLTRPPR